MPNVVNVCAFFWERICNFSQISKGGMTLYMSRNTPHLILSSFLFLLCQPAGDCLSLKGQCTISEIPWNHHIGVLDTSPSQAADLHWAFLQISSSHQGLPVRTLWATCGLEDIISQLDCKACCRHRAVGRLQVAEGRVAGAETSGGSWEGRSLLSGLTERPACPVPMEHE